MPDVSPALRVARLSMVICPAVQHGRVRVVCPQDAYVMVRRAVFPSERGTIRCCILQSGNSKVQGFSSRKYQLRFPSRMQRYDYPQEVISKRVSRSRLQAGECAVPFPGQIDASLSLKCRPIDCITTPTQSGGPFPLKTIPAKISRSPQGATDTIMSPSDPAPCAAMRGATFPRQGWQSPGH